MMKKLLLCSFALAATCAVVSNANADLIAHWDFEEGTGNTTTAEHGEAGGTTSGAFADTWSTDFAAPGSTGSYNFGNVAGGINTNLTSDLGLAPGFSGSGAKTIMAWVKTTTLQQDAYFGYSPTNGGGAGADLRLLINGNGGDTTGKFRVEVSSGGFEAGSGLNDGNWHMVAAVFNANDGINDVDVYIDGVYTTRSGGGQLVNTAATPSVGAPNPNILLGESGNTSRPYTGLLDDVAIFNTALSVGELDAIRTAGIHSPVPEPTSLALLGLGAIGFLSRRRR